MKIDKRLILSFFVFFSLYSIASNEVWNQKSNFGGSARHRSTAFSIGNKGYIGLGHINAVSNVSYQDFWEYDPSTNTWTQIADFGGGLRYHSIGFSANGKGYVGLGREEDGDYENDLWEYDPLSNTWLQKTNFPGGDRRGSVVFVIDNIAYVGSGEVQGAAVSNEFFAYDASIDFWYPIAAFPGLERTSAVAFSIDDKGYFGTGGMAFGSTDFWEYNPTSNLWTQLADVGTVPRMEACGFAVNGKGYIGTGDDFSSGNNYADFWEFDPLTGTWSQIQDFPGIARRYMVSFVIGNKAFVGVGTNGTNFRDFWEFDKTLQISHTESESSLLLYPNPCNDFINIQFEETFGVIDCTMILYDMSGKAILNEQLNSGNHIINTSLLNKGMYEIVIVKKNEVIFSSQILKN